eukprot:m.240974 g.240974  ORF g.240974 m.240974 type:complete len:210 (+) comp16848_c0_seq1:139-768(+)
MSDFRGNGRSQEAIMSELQDSVKNVDWMAIAIPCSVKSCNQHDFLPCKCSECGAVTCQDHLQDHNCEKPVENKEVPQCPLCNKFVFVRASEDVNVVIEEHISSNCTLRLLKERTKKNRKKKCPVKGCKQRLLFPVECASCREQYCTSHRFPDSHSCTPTSCHTQARRRKQQKSHSSQSQPRSSTSTSSPIDAVRRHWQSIWAQRQSKTK